MPMAQYPNVSQIKATIRASCKSTIMAREVKYSVPPILLLLIVTCFLAVQCICNLGQFISLLPARLARNSFVFTHDRTGFVALGWANINSAKNNSSSV